MKNPRLASFLWIIHVTGLIAGVTPSFASVRETTPLTLSDFLAEARKNDPEVRRILHDRLATRHIEGLTVPSAPLMLRSSTEYGLSPTDNQSNWTLNTSVEQGFPSIGGRIVVSHDRSARPDRREEVTSVLYRQSLLNNAFGTTYRHYETIAETEIRATDLQVAENYEQYVARALSLYFDWQLAHLNHQAALSQHKEAHQLLNNIRARQSQNIADPVDVDKVRLQMLDARQTLRRTEGELAEAVQAVAKITGREPDALNPAGAVFFERKVDTESQLKRFLDEGRTLKLLDLSESAETHRLAIEKKERLPALETFAGYRIDDSIRFQTPIDRSEILVGLSLEFPIGDSRTLAEADRAAFNLTGIQLARHNTRVRTRTEAKALYARIEQQRDTMELARQGRDLARKIVATEDVHYRQGRINLERLIDSRTLLVQNEFRYLSSRAELSKTMVQWYALLDQLIDSRTLELTHDLIGSR